MADSSYEIKNVNGHYEVYLNGLFYCSADTMPEAIEELEKGIGKCESRVMVGEE